MKKTILSIGFILMITFAYTQTSINKTKHANTEKNIAIDGYDPVAYFTQNKAIKGNKKFAVSVDGIIYYCSSQINKDLLVKTPTKYEPQYGGWCAYAMGAKGTKVEIDPETFKIKDGKLYLFYNKTFTNTLPLWNKDEVNLKTKADENWKIILSK
jgi:YHS domain-containing protein